MSQADRKAGRSTERLDPTSFSVISRALQSVAEEMAITFEYSALSSILSEARDYSCAIYAVGDPPSAVCNLPAIPVHINAQPVATGYIAKFFADEVYDGDIMMVNSSYYGGTHIGDLVVACPVFYKGKHLFWAVATGHHADVGSAYNTSVPVQATDVWKEGLQISPLKLEERGKLRRDVLELYLGNLRYREFCHGDLMSQVGSVKTAKRRLIELLDRWGTEIIEQFADEIIDYADRRTSTEIATWKDGVYSAESWVDSDGTGMADIAIRCKMTIKGDMVDLDFAGSDPQARGGVNASEAVCQNAASTPILLCLDPDMPHNHGCLRHINVSAPKGTITHVEWPGSTADSTIVPADSISDVVWKCLAQAIPEKVLAGFGHIAPNAVTSGYDRRSADKVTPWSAIFFNGSSGGGACLEHDGWPLMYSPGTVGSLSFVPIEILELHYPIVVRQHELRMDSMGAGRTRGGAGITFHVEPRGTGQIDNYAYGDGMANPPFGLFGGKPGDGGALYRVNADGTHTYFSMISYFRVGQGESYVGLSTGGGGYGDPFERPSEKVLDDVRNELVSVESAARDYGVAIDAQSLTIDQAKTSALRAKGSGRKGLLIEPQSKSAATFYKDRMRPGDTFEFNPQPPANADSTL